MSSRMVLAAVVLISVGCAAQSEPIPDSGAGPGGTGGAGGGATVGNGGGVTIGTGTTSSSSGTSECNPGDVEGCYAGPQGTEGVGACQAGERTCTSQGEFGVWGPCEGEVLPSAEVCDAAGADEDCNGSSDEVCPCEPTSEICDGLDNDCDGVVDEDLLQQCPDGCDVQACESGQWGPCGGSNVLLDESFENVAAPQVGLAPPTVISSFTIDAGDVDAMVDGAGFYGPAHTGIKAIDLNGWNPGTISAAIPTVAGEKYVLTFAYTKNPGKPGNGVPGPATASVFVDGNPMVDLVANPNNAYDDLQWTCAAISWTATGATSTIELSSTNPGNGGIYLDSFIASEP